MIARWLVQESFGYQTAAPELLQRSASGLAGTHMAAGANLLPFATMQKQKHIKRIIKYGGINLSAPLKAGL